MAWRVHAISIRDSRGELVWWLPFVRKWRLGAGQINVCLPLSPQIGPAVQRTARTFQPPSLECHAWPVEIHERVAMPGAQHTVNHHVTVLDLTRYASLDALRKAFHAQSIRQKIKKAEKSDLRHVKGTGQEHFAAFDRLEVLTRQRQGSPAYPARFFCHMAEELGSEDTAHLHLVYLDARPVAGVVFLYDRTGATYGYGASVNEREVWQMGANQLAMWAAIREAYERGMPRVSFGTTPAAQRELREYKEKWGAESEELAYTVGNERAQALQVERTGLAARMVSAALTQMPESLFRWISPVITRAVT
jgi:hypothetical protein